MGSNDSDRKAALERLRHRAPLPDPTGDVVEDLLRAAQAWVLAVREADVHRREESVAGAGISAREHLDDLDARFDTELKARLAPVFALASKAGNLSVWDERIEDLLTLMRAMRTAEENWLSGPINYLDPEGTKRKAMLPFVLRKSLDELFSRLRVLGSSLPRPATPPRPLGELEQQVFNALRGKILLAKDLASIVGEPATVTTVHKAIARIRKKGHAIREIKRRGYYRTDAPPPGIEDGPRATSGVQG